MGMFAKQISKFTNVDAMKRKVKTNPAAAGVVIQGFVTLVGYSAFFNPSINDMMKVSFLSDYTQNMWDLYHYASALITFYLAYLHWNGDLKKITKANTHMKIATVLATLQAYETAVSYGFIQSVVEIPNLSGASDSNLGNVMVCNAVMVALNLMCVAQGQKKNTMKLF